jgi:hypothetical protein
VLNICLSAAVQALALVQRQLTVAVAVALAAL